jgi:hypothetical protein
MKIDFFPLKRGAVNQVTDVDLEHELPRLEASARAKTGDVIVVKLWLRTTGPANLEQLEAQIAAAVAPLGVK